MLNTEQVNSEPRVGEMRSHESVGARDVKFYSSICIVLRERACVCVCRDTNYFIPAMISFLITMCISDEATAKFTDSIGVFFVR